jgi:hypothetical protein
VVHGEAGSFDQTATWTGSVVKGPDGTWHLFYTGVSRPDDTGHVQQIGLATSTDLMTWTKHPDNPLITADSRWYETLGGPAPWQDEHWRDPWCSPTTMVTAGTCSSPPAATPAPSTTAASSAMPTPPTYCTGTSNHRCPNPAPGSDTQLRPDRLLIQQATTPNARDDPRDAI